MKFLLFAAVAATAIFSSCKKENSMDALLESLHASMVEHDSILKVTHDKLNQKHQQWKLEYQQASGGEIDSLHLKLEQAHDMLLERHDDIIDKHEVILRLHKRLIDKFKKGNTDKSFVEEEHKILEEEYRLMQQDHDQLLSDHAKLEKDHAGFISSLNKNKQLK